MKIRFPISLEVWVRKLKTVLCFILKLFSGVHCSGFRYYSWRWSPRTPWFKYTVNNFPTSQLPLAYSIIPTTHLQINNKVLTGAEFSNIPGRNLILDYTWCIKLFKSNWHRQWTIHLQAHEYYRQEKECAGEFCPRQ